MSKISYSTCKGKQSITELLTMHVQEEERSKLKKPESTHLVSQANGNVKNSKMALKVKKHRNMSIKQHGNNNKCFFYKK